MKRVIAALFALLALPVAAQSYPAKTVRIVVPFPAGGSTDILARVAAENLNKSYGQVFIVDNRPGATGTIGGAIVASSAPDGYTLIMHSVSTYIAAFLYRKISYDAARAFTPVVNLSVNPFLLVSSSGLPARSVKELIALARQHPNQLTFGTVGNGSGSHLVAEMFNTAAGIRTVSVPYKGSAPVMVAVASGEVGFTVNNILDTRPFVNQGKMRALAVTSATRSRAAPDVPTLKESGLDVEANLWTGLFAPTGTPRAVVNKLNEDLVRILDTPQMKEWLLGSLGGEFTSHTPEQFAAFIATDTARWQKIARQINVHLD
jgi:tripartite-type tricarboxylate transporter receptor subunit TctC